MRPSFAVVSLLFTGCFEGEVGLFGCPPDEVCSDDTPNGLHFFGASLANHLELDNEQTVVGGIQRVRLAHPIGDSFVNLESGYVASENGPSIVVEGQEGAIVTLRGAAAGYNHLEIRDADDASLMDRKLFGAAELSAISVTSPRLEHGSRPDIAFLPGAIRFAVALRDAEGLRLVDESLAIDLPGSTSVSWDTFGFPDAPVGTMTIPVTAAGQPPANVDLVVVPAVEEIIERPPVQPLYSEHTGHMCFEAVGSQRFIVGLDWTYTIDNGELEERFGPGCVMFVPSVAGDVTITASAGGVVKVVTYTVTEKLAKPSPAGRPPGLTGGERATAVASSSR